MYIGYMKIKIVYDNAKDRELIESIEFSTPFFVEYIDALTKNGLKESYHADYFQRLNQEASSLPWLCGIL